jgi:CheY-like chemotaxis protein
MSNAAQTPPSSQSPAGTAAPAATGVAALDQEKVQKFREFLKDQLVFIVDTASASRRRLAATMVGLGAQMSKVTLHGSFEEAEADMKERKPRIVICDYMIGNRSGLDLLQAQRTAFPEGKDCLFLLVTGNTSQSAVARAAEEDIDSFILKPYTINSLTESIVSAAINKLYPTEYRKIIEEGKQLLFSGRIDESMTLFEKAIGMNPKPALACFYFGQAEMMKQALADARGSFLKGISFNKIHYKCLVGLFDLFMSQKSYAEAYDIIRRVQKYFPANPRRLASVIRLAVLNEKFEDIETLYSIFKEMEIRDDDITRHMVAGLIVAAQNRLRKGEQQRAVEVFNDAAVSCAGQTGYLRKIVEILCDNNLPEAVQGVLNRFPPANQSETDFLVSRYLFLNLTAQTGVSIQFGQSLIRDGHHTLSLYLTLAWRMGQFAKKDAAEAMIYDGIKRFPAEKEKFENLRKVLGIA